MPTTKKETFLFGLIMCFGMVLIMTVYNLFLNGIMGEMTIIAIVSDFATGFMIALMLDLLIIGPNAKKVALKLTKNVNNSLIKILAISTCMVFGMAFFMSIYGLVSTYIHTDKISNSVVLDYLAIYGKNLMVALPLQLLVMGPIVRFIFVKLIKNRDNDAELNNRITIKN
ncbi:DUF2798 domain-containing protein [Marinilactibacillus psychrotolerans]|uniref:DUF2798 domain-containing protein n=1 Tax=Marinilactibacillus psychrotolerans 42ea TaxID=1255609 RepID=A0A1R4JFV7_9LACT|nr:DUF2798 domain-containing protein [Marinilactibacillus psychrotolerans]SJN31071.1 hypothetical protein FM115_05360 [Marinilactibacillus psychrotolerans 42ea]